MLNNLSITTDSDLKDLNKLFITTDSDLKDYSFLESQLLHIFDKRGLDNDNTVVIRNDLFTERLVDEFVTNMNLPVINNELNDLLKESTMSISLLKSTNARIAESNLVVIFSNGTSDYSDLVKELTMNANTPHVIVYY